MSEDAAFADLRAELGIEELKEAVKANGDRLDRIEGHLEALVAELGAQSEEKDTWSASRRR